MLSEQAPLRRLQKSCCYNTRLIQARWLHLDGRNRLSNFWAPTGGLSSEESAKDDGHSLLLRGGFLRQAHSGIFHLLPLGLRVQSKLEQHLDKHMMSIGASKLSLSSISSEKLWQKSGRIEGPLTAGSELFSVKDRKKSGFLLSPTHEEEISTLISPMVDSYKKLPLRLYQISRKYRDELRPRQGLLRSKEFLMKDLYTFDSSKEAALETYEKVRAAYHSLFTDLGIPFLTAEADSGNMGGKLSHEYHFESPSGEDTVWTCNECKYTANDEVVGRGTSQSATAPLPTVKIWHGISKDRSTKIAVAYAAENDNIAPRLADLSIQVLKQICPDLDTSIDADVAILKHQPQSTTYVIDQRLSDDQVLPSESPTNLDPPTILRPDISITTIQPGDPCPRCPSGHLTPHRTIEVGHTFHLGTRYSAPLNVTFKTATQGAPNVPLEMGCHGIGVSRLIGAISNILAAPTGHSSPPVGLRWPLLVAPFQVLIIADDKYASEAQGVYDMLNQSSAEKGNNKAPLRGNVPDVLLDDRDKPLGWRLKDADLIGYPIVVILGKQLKTKGLVEVHCRKTGEHQSVSTEALRDAVEEMLEQS